MRCKGSSHSFRGATALCLAVLALWGGLAFGTRHQPGSRAEAAPGPTVLVLHDSAGPWGYLGAEYAIMVRNLLGHFTATVTTMPVTAYTAGRMSAYTATIYIGSTYEEASYYGLATAQGLAYTAFLNDAAMGAKPLIWLNYNLWRLSQHMMGDQFRARFGFDYLWLDGEGKYNRVAYKDVELLKGVVPWDNPGAALDGCLNEGDGEGPATSSRTSRAWACSTELNVVSIADPAVAVVYARASSTLTGADAPYVTRGGNLWFVADLPFTHFSEEDRYLAFTDLLHDMLGIDHPPSHRALVRLEDVSAGSDPAELQAVTDLLRSRNVPFGVAAIPIYTDPLGVYSGGVPETVSIAGSQVGSLLRSLAAARWASIVQHGTTHQSNTAPNPYNKVSGDDFEFYRVIRNADESLTFAGPMPGDSVQWARRRIQDGKRELDRAGLLPFAWEAPHYVASQTDYVAIRGLGGPYAVSYSRLVYFSRTSPAGRLIGQFYPYVIWGDLYQYWVVPENIGYIEPEPNAGYRALLPADLVRHADKARVVRDGFASFYFHPYLDPAYLGETIDGIRALGYEFVAPCSVVARCPKMVAPASPPVTPQGSVVSASTWSTK